MKTRKTKTAIAVSALVGIAVIGSTFAYWSQTATIDNPFDTGDYGTSTIEKFNPSDGEDWEPGATITKEVLVSNDGDYDLIVRAKLDETWADSETSTVYKTNEAVDTSTLGIGDVYTVGQYNLYDGLTGADNSVVAKNLSASENWVDGEDGWYYYAVNLAPGENTDNWLESVTLNEDVDMGVYNTTNYVSTDDGATWIVYDAEDEDGMPVYVGTSTNNNGVTYFYYDEESANAVNPDNITVEFVTNNKSVVTIDDDLTGYSDSDYTLTITVETVQATEAAVEDMFGITLANETYDDAWTYAEYAED